MLPQAERFNDLEIMPKRKRMSKSAAEVKHFERRSEERLGTRIDRKYIERQIRAGKLDLYDKQSNRVSRYEYYYDGKIWIVVYDKNRHKAVTIFSKEKENGT